MSTVAVACELVSVALSAVQADVELLRNDRKLVKDDDGDWVIGMTRRDGATRCYLSVSGPKGERLWSISGLVKHFQYVHPGVDLMPDGEVFDLKNNDDDNDPSFFTQLQQYATQLSPQQLTGLHTLQLRFHRKYAYVMKNMLDVMGAEREVSRSKAEARIRLVTVNMANREYIQATERIVIAAFKLSVVCQNENQIRSADLSDARMCTRGRGADPARLWTTLCQDRA
jgi:hypothetical protein